MMKFLIMVCPWAFWMPSPWEPRGTARSPPWHPRTHAHMHTARMHHHKHQHLHIHQLLNWHKACRRRRGLQAHIHTIAVASSSLHQSGQDLDRIDENAADLGQVHYVVGIQHSETLRQLSSRLNLERGFAPREQRDGPKGNWLRLNQVRLQT